MATQALNHLGLQRLNEFLTHSHKNPTSTAVNEYIKEVEQEAAIIGTVTDDPDSWVEVYVPLVHSKYGWNICLQLTHEHFKLQAVTNPQP